MAIFLTLGAIYREVERGTILSIVPKPLARWEVVFGKWLGYVVLILVYLTSIGLGLWVVVTIDLGAFIWDYIVALFFISLNMVTMVTLTLFFSTFLPNISNGFFVFLLLAFTSNLRVLFTIGQATGNQILSDLAGWLRLLLPVSEVSDLADQAVKGQLRQMTEGVAGINFLPRDWIFVYEMGYIVVFLLLAVYIFQRKDLR